MPTPKVQNVGDVLGAGNFIVSTVKVFTSPRIIAQVCYLNYSTIMWEIFVKCGIAGDETRMC